jgi:hypothetical protein
MSKDFVAFLHALLVMACGLYVSHGCYAFARLRLTRGLPVNKLDDMWDLRQRGDKVVLLYGGGPFPSHDSSQSECMSWISLGNVDSPGNPGSSRPDEGRFNPWIRTCWSSLDRGCCLFALVTEPGYSGDGTSPRTPTILG